MQFKDIVGQPDVKQRLTKAYKEKRIPHAIIFTGPAGTGKLAMAIAFAQMVCCQNPTQNDSCGTCPSCKKYAKIIHPDLHFAFPVNESKKESADDKVSKSSGDHLSKWRECLLENPYFTEAEWYESIGLDNKQGIISVSESSEVIKKISLKSFESEYKTMIIWLPERMNVNASNRLLKLIEEPPLNTLFILVSEDPNLVIKTILSRCQLIRFAPLTRESVSSALIERYQLSPAKAQEYSRVANGNYAIAQNLAKGDNDSIYFLMFRDIMRLCFQRDVPGALEWVEKAAALNRERQKELLTEALRLTRESMVLNSKMDDIAYLAGEELQFGERFAPQMPPDRAMQVYPLLNSAINDIARNGNGQIIFTDTVLKLLKVMFPIKTLP
ncbi:MAG: DNA polymerase III subunit delta [Bacteroidales bacterium]|nr:DNA polymerase III subunit delta [Bacteroidales bacterium]MBN2748411.1 DNA polymerase III subunit delta [Bacteroidales bacterium]